MTAHRHKNAAGKWVTTTDGPHTHSDLADRIAALEAAAPPVVIPPPLPAGSPPVAAIKAIPASGTAPLTVQLSDMSTGQPTEWAWDIGAGTFKFTTRDPVVTLPAADTWDVSLTVKNAHGQSTAATTIPVTAPSAPPPPPPPPPEPIPGPLPTGKTVTVSSGQAWPVSDGTIDTLVIGDGPHAPGYVRLPVRVSGKPLLIVAANKWAATFRGTLAARNGAAFCTVDGLSVEGNSVGDTGIFTVGGWVESPPHDLAFLRLRFRNNRGASPDQSHNFYISYDTPTNILIDDLTILDCARSMTGVHSYHNPNGRGVTVRNFDIRNVSKGFLLWSDMTGLVLANGKITDANMGIDISSSVKGRIDGVVISGVGSNALGSGMVRGSGNVGF